MTSHSAFMVIVQGKNVNLLSEVKLAQHSWGRSVVGSIQHNVQETLKKTGKRMTYKRDLSDSLTPCFRTSSSHFTEKISRHFQEKALPPYRFQPVRDVSSSTAALCPSGETLTLNQNPRVGSGHQRNDRPQGIRGARAHRGALCEILDVFFYFYCFVSYQFLAFYRENLTSFPRKNCDKRCFLRLMTLPIQGSYQTVALCPSGETLCNTQY